MCNTICVLHIWYDLWSNVGQSGCVCEFEKSETCNIYIYKRIYICIYIHRVCAKCQIDILNILKVQPMRGKMSWTYLWSWYKSHWSDSSETWIRWVKITHWVYLANLKLTSQSKTYTHQNCIHNPKLPNGPKWITSLNKVRLKFNFYHDTPLILRNFKKMF